MEEYCTFLTTFVCCVWHSKNKLQKRKIKLNSDEKD